jgi:hypothetical protein
MRETKKMIDIANRPPNLLAEGKSYSPATTPAVWVADARGALRLAQETQVESWGGTEHCANSTAEHQTVQRRRAGRRRNDRAPRVTP